jgi:hypothetical protein
LQFRRSAALREVQQGKEQPGQGEAEHDRAGHGDREQPGGTHQVPDGEVRHPGDRQPPFAQEPQQPTAYQAGHDRARTERGREHPEETGRLADALDEAVLSGHQHTREAHDHRGGYEQPKQTRRAADVSETSDKVRSPVFRLRRRLGFGQPDPRDHHRRHHECERVEDADCPASEQRE